MAFAALERRVRGSLAFAACLLPQGPALSEADTQYKGRMGLGNERVTLNVDPAIVDPAPRNNFYERCV